jgi:chromosome segregation ATPase
MAKRSTIGENPLDAQFQENPLDTVVPNLSVVDKAGRARPNAEALAEIQERVLALEAGLETLGTQLAATKTAVTEAASLKSTVGGVQEELARLRREVEQLSADAAAAKALEAEVTLLKGELAQIRAAAGPGDLPWWMRGKKK